jgi:enoyl-CoA hydratase
VNTVLRTELRDRIAVLTLDRPGQLNAIGSETTEQLKQTLAGIRDNDDVRALVITGAGRAFSAGADLGEIESFTAPGQFRAFVGRLTEAFALLEDFPKPSVAAVHGFAFGGGLELALACDLRVVADDATLGLTEVGIGTLPGWGGTGRLRALVGAGRAKQMIFTGEPLNADRALAWGIANELAPKAEVIPTAHALASKIAVRAPIAVQMAKQAVDAGDAFQAMEQVASAATAFTADAAEGLASFTEKRDPRYRGT